MSADTPKVKPAPTPIVEPAPALSEFAADGMPRVDVIELATAILQGGARRETPVSQREARALALYTNDANIVLSNMATLIDLIEANGDKPVPKITEWLVEWGEKVRRGLEQLGYMDPEQRA